MKRLILTLLTLLLLAVPAAAREVPVLLDAKMLPSPGELENGTTYVSMREFCEALGLQVWWADGAAHARSDTLTLTATPGAQYLIANGRYLYIPGTVRFSTGCTLVPVRTLAKAVGASVQWDSAQQAAVVSAGSEVLESGETFYPADELNWLSRIISAESRGEPLAGQIAVGNVVLSRVASSDFPDTIYDVIFDTTGGVQFTPTVNGQIELEPAACSVLAAKLVLDGADVAGDCLFFFDPVHAQSDWIATHCTYRFTIGSHQFYAP